MKYISINKKAREDRAGLVVDRRGKPGSIAIDWLSADPNELLGLQIRDNCHGVVTGPDGWVGGGGVGDGGGGGLWETVFRVFLSSSPQRRGGRRPRPAAAEASCPTRFHWRLCGPVVLGEDGAGAPMTPATCFLSPAAPCRPVASFPTAGCGCKSLGAQAHPTKRRHGACGGE
jgi:hypothetical protein